MTLYLFTLFFCLKPKHLCVCHNINWNDGWITDPPLQLHLPRRLEVVYLPGGLHKGGRVEVGFEEVIVTALMFSVISSSFESRISERVKKPRKAA